MLKIGGTEITDVMLGSTQVNKVYQGSNLIWEKSSPLPYDAEVEWLESDGGQYIALGSKLQSSTDVIDLEISMSVLSSDGYGSVRLFGARSGASSKNFSLITDSSDHLCLDVQGASYSTYRLSFEYTKDTFYTIHLAKALRSVSLNGTVLASKTNSSSNFTTDLAAYLFSFNQSGNTWKYGYCKIKSLKWKRSGSDYMDLVPVRVGQVGYMYDKVSGNLLGNAGTGNFLLGNDVNI